MRQLGHVVLLLFSLCVTSSTLNCSFCESDVANELPNANYLWKIPPSTFFPQSLPYRAHFAFSLSNRNTSTNSFQGFSLGGLEAGSSTLVPVLEPDLLNFNLGTKFRTFSPFFHQFFANFFFVGTDAKVSLSQVSSYPITDPVAGQCAVEFQGKHCILYSNFF